MMNRYLCLLVAVVAPASAAVMLLAGAHAVGTVTLAERAPDAGLALLAIVLAALCLRAEPTPSSRADAAMWCGLATFFVVATVIALNLAPWSIAAALSLAAMSIARRFEGRRRSVSLAADSAVRRSFA